MKTNLSIANQSHQNRFADDTTSVVVAWSINDSARSEDPAESRSFVLPAIAGIGYGLAWIAGLLVWPSNLAIDSTGRQVVGLYSHHVTQAAVQYILVEGVAGVLLGTVLFYLLRALQRQSPETKMLLPALLALSATALSVFAIASWDLFSSGPLSPATSPAAEISLHSSIGSMESNSFAFVRAPYG